MPLLLALRYAYTRAGDLGNLLPVEMRLGDAAEIFKWGNCGIGIIFLIFFSSIISDSSKLQSSVAVRQWVSRHVLYLFETNPLATCAVLSNNTVRIFRAPRNYFGNFWQALFPVGSIVTTLDGEPALLHCYLKYLLVTRNQPALCRRGGRGFDPW